MDSTGVPVVKAETEGQPATREGSHRLDSDPPGRNRNPDAPVSWRYASGNPLPSGWRDQKGLPVRLLSSMYNASMKRIHDGPLARVGLKDRVADLIKDAILAGKLGPGDRIVELALANQLRVGTTAVREALFDLESQGFVNRVANRGTFVTKLSLQDVEEILQVRSELEGLAVELAQERRTEEDLALLEECTSEMVTATQDEDWPRFYRNDLEFHRNIWRIAGNRYLAKSLDVLVVPLFAFFIMKIQGDPGELKWVGVEKHVDIVRALRDGHDARKCIEASLGYFGHLEGRILFGASADKQ